MICKKCGANVGNASFCTNCGAKMNQPVNNNPVYANDPPQNNYGQQNDDRIRCPSCGGTNVNVQVVTTSQMVNAHHGCLWWCFVGWWWIPTKWIFLTVPAIFAKLFIPKKQRLKQKNYSECVCQSCGNHWRM